MGTYVIPGIEDGVELQLEEGSDLADIEFRDYADNGLVNGGDQLLISGLAQDQYYTIRLYWTQSNEFICYERFWTPP
ncbi:MAG: hypothetical protein E3J35_07295 [Methanomassiliicoccales archaeon]|nr:MAG: hypothetical protein E3J35_07295 [Methanomassiliicoccales archaeon]